jgi:hypothetical protein
MYKNLKIFAEYFSIIQTNSFSSKIITLSLLSKSKNNVIVQFFNQSIILHFIKKISSKGRILRSYQTQSNNSIIFSNGNFDR